MVLKAFECSQCETEFDDIVSMDIKTSKCECGGKAHSIIKPVYLSKEVGHFNPHYDLQMGTYFESKEQKKKWLKENDREQVSGFSSPRESNKTNVICTKDQAIKEYGPLK